MKTDIIGGVELINNSWIGLDDILCRRTQYNRQFMRFKNCGWLKRKMLKNEELSINGNEYFLYIRLCLRNYF